MDPVAETDEDVDIMPTPQIQSCNKYPPKGPARKLTEEPSPAGLADAEELEAREARGKRVAELIQKELPWPTQPRRSMWPALWMS
jgi:hypothetical protein